MKKVYISSVVALLLNSAKATKQGLDPDVEQTLKHIKQAEVERNHKYNPGNPWHNPIPYPINYKVPNFGVDEDIIATQKHYRDTKKRVGKSLS